MVATLRAALASKALVVRDIAIFNISLTTGLHEKYTLVNSFDLRYIAA